MDEPDEVPDDMAPTGYADVTWDLDQASLPYCAGCQQVFSEDETIVVTSKLPDGSYLTYHPTCVPRWLQTRPRRELVRDKRDEGVPEEYALLDWKHSVITQNAYCRGCREPFKLHEEILLSSAVPRKGYLRYHLDCAPSWAHN